MAFLEFERDGFILDPKAEKRKRIAESLRRKMDAEEAISKTKRDKR